LPAATAATAQSFGPIPNAADEQGYLQYHPPLTLAETASIFGEMIVFRQMLHDCPSPAERYASRAGLELAARASLSMPAPWLLA
jgi:hypothetical protein